jgi:Secretion system C-terminal sorting domain
MGIDATATPNTTSTPNGTATATLYCINDAVTYLWSNGEITPTISGLAAGTYTVTVTTASGNTFTATTTVGTFINTQNTKQNINDFSLQPNPTSGVLMLNASFDLPTASVIQLQNAVGEVLFIQNNTANAILQTELDLSHLPAGVYFVALSTTNGMQTRRIVVAR